MATPERASIDGTSPDRGAVAAGRIAVVLGASGYMGSNLAPALAAHGWRVRAVARNAAVLEAREWKGDFDGMLQRRHIRVLVPYSRTPPATSCCSTSPPGWATSLPAT